MAEEELTVVGFHNNYYRDSFDRVLIIAVIIIVAIGCLLGVIVYNYLKKPAPVTFLVAQDMRVQLPKEYLDLSMEYPAEADLLQWVSEVIPDIFQVDFLRWDEEVQAIQKFFTPNGYQIFINQLNNYASKTFLQSKRLFTKCTPLGAPVILDKRAVGGHFAWRIQIPVQISYAGAFSAQANELRIVINLIRSDTADSLSGVLIDDVVIEQGRTSTIVGTGR